MKRWLKEPLLHFLLIGAGLFVLFYQVADLEAESDNRIVISATDVDRLIALFERKWQRLPSPQELDGLVEAEIREEILYREALAMGLDDDDTIVRRRMAQKVEFLFNDLADTAQPTDEDLQGFLEQHPDKFTESARTSFAHVYFNADKRGASTDDEARDALQMLNLAQSLPDLASIGDPFMLGYVFEAQSEPQVSRMFGRDFVASLGALQPGTWQGPISSGYGLHLVYVSARTMPRLPPLDEIRESVLREVLNVRRIEANRAFYKRLRERYTVVVERPQAETTNDSSAESV